MRDFHPSFLFFSPLVALFSPLELHFGSKKTGNLSLVFEDLLRNSVFFSNRMKPYVTHLSPLLLPIFSPLLSIFSDRAAVDVRKATV